MRKSEKLSRGLRHFSMKVCEKVKEKVTTTYNEVADDLVREFTAQQNSINSPLADQYDQKNIRRRVYDALNVLMAMNIISKEKKEIRWIGLPTNSLQVSVSCSAANLVFTRKCCRSISSWRTRCAPNRWASGRRKSSFMSWLWARSPSRVWRSATRRLRSCMGNQAPTPAFSCLLSSSIRTKRLLSTVASPMISKSKFYIYFLRNYSRFKAFIWFVTGEVMRLICGALVAQSFVFKWTKSRFLGIFRHFLVVFQNCV